MGEYIRKKMAAFSAVGIILSTAGPCSAIDVSEYLTLLYRDIVYVPAWSNDGRVLTTSVGSKLVVADSDGSKSWPVATGEDFAWGYNDTVESSPSLSVDGMIAYRKGRVDEQPGLFGRPLETAIYSMGVDATKHRKLTGIGELIDDPVWSPDGTRLAFTAEFDEYQGRRDVRVLGTVAADGSDLRLYSATGNAGRPAWSPDGLRIAVADGERRRRERHRLAIVDWQTGRVVKSITAPAGSRTTVSEHLDWSRSDGTLYYVMRTVEGDTSRDQLFSNRSGGTSARVLFQTTEGYEIAFLDAAPDGEALMFILRYRNPSDWWYRSGYLVMLYTESGHARALADLNILEVDAVDESHRVYVQLPASLVLGSSWSPDGSKIAVHFAPENIVKNPTPALLVTMAADGSDTRPILVRDEKTGRVHPGLGTPLPEFAFLDMDVLEKYVHEDARLPR